MVIFAALKFYCINRILCSFCRRHPASMCAGRLCVLSMVLLTTCILSGADNCMPEGICSGSDFLVALQDDSVLVVQLWQDIWLAPSNWPVTPFVRRANFTLKGRGATRVLLDFSLLAERVTLAHGVVLKLQDLEYRNAGVGVGFGIDLLTPSPGARVELHNVAVFTYVCLPFEFLIPVIQGYRAALPPDAALDAQQRIATSSNSWCRTTPAIARCFKNTITLMRAVLPLDANTTSGTYDTLNGASHGIITTNTNTASPPIKAVVTMYGNSYTLVAYNSTLVCQERTTVSCGWREGYEACLTSRREQLGKEDDTWALLTAAAADSEATGQGDDMAGGGDGSNDTAGGGGGSSGFGHRSMGKGPLAGSISGAVVGALLLAGGLLLLLLLRRSHMQQQQRHAQYRVQIQMEQQQQQQQQPLPPVSRQESPSPHELQQCQPPWHQQAQQQQLPIPPDPQHPYGSPFSLLRPQYPSDRYVNHRYNQPPNRSNDWGRALPVPADRAPRLLLPSHPEDVSDDTWAEELQWQWLGASAGAGARRNGAGTSQVEIDNGGGDDQDMQIGRGGGGLASFGEPGGSGGGCGLSSSGAVVEGGEALPHGFGGGSLRKSAIGPPLRAPALPITGMFQTTMVPSTCAITRTIPTAGASEEPIPESARNAEEL